MTYGAYWVDALLFALYAAAGLGGKPFWLALASFLVLK